MNPTKLTGLFCLTLSALFFSCKKDHTVAPAPDPTPAPVTSTRHLDLIFLAGQNNFGRDKDTLRKYELIISETNGKNLLDTVMPYNTHVIADMKTNQSLFNVTILFFSPFVQAFSIQTYKAIDISGLKNVPGSDSIPGLTFHLDPTTDGNVTYTNVHTVSGDPYYTAVGLFGESSQWNGGNISYSYTYHPGDYAYLIFPFSKLYKIHPISSAAEVVDFSKPDTAVGVKFNRPAIYPNYNFSLAGFPDTNNLSKFVSLSYDGAAFRSIPGADIVYPGKKVFQKYSFSYNAYDADYKNVVSYSLPSIDTIPADIPFPDPAWYTLTAAPNTVTADFTTHKPVSYDINCTIGKMFFTLTAAGDSTVQHPLDFLTSLKSKLLNGQDLSSLKISDIRLVSETGSNYQTYCSRQFDMTSLARTQITYQHIF